MIKTVILTIYIFSFRCYSCEVAGPENIVFNSKENPSSALELIKLNDCNEVEVNKIHNSLTDFEGIIRKRTLMAEIPELEISVKKPIHIKRLQTLLNEKVPLPKNWKLINPQILTLRNKAITFKKNSLVSIDCQNCTSTGLKNLKLEIFDHLSAQKKVLWVKASVAIKTEVLSATRALPVNHKGLSALTFKKEEIYSANPEAYFTNRSQLIFYKLNKGLKSGYPVKFTDLSALNLVVPGQVVRTNLKSGVIKLSGNATPIKAGKMGEIIQLRTNNSKKIILGRVTNFNEVEVEL